MTKLNWVRWHYDRPRLSIAEEDWFKRDKKKQQIEGSQRYQDCRRKSKEMVGVLRTSLIPWVPMPDNPFTILPSMPSPSHLH
jgi:hypothetical protein